MDFTMIDFAQARRNMVDSQLRPNGITDGRILEAMGHVAREGFVGQGQEQLAYMDGEVALKGIGQTARSLIEPMVFARLLQAADVRADDHVLDIGAATGYGAAVLSRLVGHVVAVENDASLAAALRQNMSGLGNVTVVETALELGAAARGPFDLIVFEGRIEAVPEALFLQVKNGGRIVCALGEKDTAKCCVYQISGATHTQRSFFDMAAARLPGFDKPKASFAF
jgi:protein-L-isoaspartate(D-aspartate) O-methyltransferase